MQRHVDNILSLVEPAIQTVEKMMGIWQAIADDLRNLKDMVDTDVRKAAAVVADIVEAKVLAKWNDLKEAGASSISQACTRANADQSFQWTSTGRRRMCRMPETCRWTICPGSCISKLGTEGIYGACKR